MKMNEVNESRNFDGVDEESQEDLESRLYAEIYHASQEKDWTSSTNEQSSNKEKHNFVQDSISNENADRGVDNVALSHDSKSPQEISFKKHKTSIKCKEVSSPNKNQQNVSNSSVFGSLNREDQTNRATNVTSDTAFQVPQESSENTFSTHNQIKDDNQRECNSIEKRLSKVDESTTKNILKEYKCSKSFINTLYKNKRRELEVKLQKEPPKDIEIITIENRVDTDSRYNVVTKCHKEKLKMLDKINLTMDNSSDSDESILEIPLPPKVPPPIVHLQDSDEDSSNSYHDLLKNQKEKSNPIGVGEYNTIQSCSNDLVVINCPDLNKTNETIDQTNELNEEITSISNSSSSCSQKQNEDNSMNKKPQNSRKRPYESETEVVNDPERTENSNTNKNKQLYTLKRRRTSLEKQTDESWNRYFFQPLTADLKSFYNDSLNEEIHHFSGIRSKMRKDPKLWSVSKEDMFPPSKRYRFWNITCAHCQRDGHHKNDCPESNAPECCHMCGIQGHTKSRCPQKMCLSCGKKQRVFKQTCEKCEKLYCNMCKTTGHVAKNCPDLWRRYHHTVIPTDEIRPEIFNTMKPQHLLHCCNCTKRGHDFSMCKEPIWSQHFPTPSYVSNYLDIPGRERHDTPEASTSSVSQIPPLIPVNQIPFQRSSDPLNQENHAERDILYTCGNDNFNSNDRFISINPLLSNDFKTKSLLNGETVPNFIEKLLILISFKVVLFRDANNRLFLEIIHHKNKSFVKNTIEQLLFIWLRMNDHDKCHFDLTLLPQEKIDMIKLLQGTIYNSEAIVQNPKKTHSKMLTLKHQLKMISNGDHRKKNRKSKTRCWPISKKQMTNALLKAQNTLNTILALLHKRKFNHFITKLEDLTDDFIPGSLYFKVMIFYHEIFHSCFKTNLSSIMKEYKDKFILKNPAHLDNTSNCQLNSKEMQSMPSTSNASAPVTNSSCKDDSSVHLKPIVENSPEFSHENVIDLVESSASPPNQTISPKHIIEDNVELEGMKNISDSIDSSNSIVEDSKNSITNQPKEVTSAPSNNIQVNTNAQQLNQNNKKLVHRTHSFDPNPFYALLAKEKQGNQKSKLLKKLQRTNRLLNSAQLAIDQALQLEIPKLTQEALQVEKKLIQYTIRRKDVEMLNKFISVCSDALKKVT